MSIYGAYQLDEGNNFRCTHFALQTRPDLGTDADAVSNLDSCNLVSNFNGFTNNLMAHTERHIGFSPATDDGMDVRTTNATRLYSDVNIMILKWFWLVLLRFWFRSYHQIQW